MSTDPATALHAVPTENRLASCWTLTPLAQSWACDPAGRPQVRMSRLMTYQPSSSLAENVKSMCP